MSKSNPVHPWRLGRTRALIFTQKLLNRAKTGVPHGTPKNFPRLGRDVSTMRKTQSTKINRKINFILHSLATRRLSVKKKSDTKQRFFPPCRNWPICAHLWQQSAGFLNCHIKYYWYIFSNMGSSGAVCSVLNDTLILYILLYKHRHRQNLVSHNPFSLF